MFASNDKKLEILNDHYKDTFSHLIRYRKQRDRLMLVMLTVLAIMVVSQFFPDQTSKSVSEVISTKIGIDFALHFVYMLILPWIVFIILSYRYWQLWNLIERQYDYVQQLEKELSSLFLSGVPFTRESGYSFARNDNLSIWSHRIYNYAFHFAWMFWVSLSITFGFRHYGFSWTWLIGNLMGATCFLIVVCKHIRRRSSTN